MSRRVIGSPRASMNSLGKREAEAASVAQFHATSDFPGDLMKTRILPILVMATACSSCVLQGADDKDVAAWERQAQNVTIIRDDWGIAHVYGKTDADAVFGVMYAQAEDDFNRVETN